MASTTIPMTPRDPAEPHRAATPLELLYDLCFVVAIAMAATSLHHAIGHGHALDGIIAFALAFFTIWWAWMNFTWFASAFDTDDPPYRLSVLVQMCGVLVLAATQAIQSALDLGHPSWTLWATIAGCPLIFFSMWWLYFAKPHADGLTRPRNAFLWGYFHYFIFASAAAVGAGLTLVVDALAHAGDHDSAPLALGLSVSIPLAIYLACLALLRLNQPGGKACAATHAAAIAIVLAASTMPGAPLWQGLAMAALTAAVVALGRYPRS